MEHILHILEAQIVEGFIIKVRFDNGKTKTVNAMPLLKGPVFEPLKSLKEFQKLSVDTISRTLVWPNGADLAPETLFNLNEEKISA